MSRTIASPVSLRADPSADSEVRGELARGDLFEVLELTSDRAWGYAPGHGLVGYVPASVLERPGA